MTRDHIKKRVYNYCSVFHAPIDKPTFHFYYMTQVDDGADLGSIKAGRDRHIDFFKQCPATVLSHNHTIIATLDYFEIERLIEDLAKLYSCSCATSWFKVEGQWNPTRDEFRNKVVEFMNHFEYTLSKFPNSPESEKFKKKTRELLGKESLLVIKGHNKEVEKRYNYFVNSR